MMNRLFPVIVAILVIPRHSDAYSAAICMNACKNLQDKASANLCEQCATNMPLDYNMCTSACGHVDDVYNRWLDNICTRCFFLKPITMIFVCKSACKNTEDEGNEIICERCYLRQ